MLTVQNAPFSEENTDKSLQAFEQALVKSQTFSTPVVDIEGEIIVGYSRQKILDALRKAKRRQKKFGKEEAKETPSPKEKVDSRLNKNIE